jgi:N-acetylmuramoyl-L-alanine amidase
MAFKIWIDGGHGGRDGGAQGNGLSEKELTLDLAKRTRTILESEYENVIVQLSRNTDVYLTLDQRTTAANNWGADVLVSIHINAATAESANGFETYIYTTAGSRTKSFQNVLHRSILKRINMDDRGQKAKNLHMVRDSKMSAVLTECGFISNKGDSAKMKQEAWKAAVARGHAEGIAEFLGLRRKAAAPAAQKPAAEKIYRVQVGAFEDKDNAEKMAADLRKQGYRPIITD